MSTSKHIVTVSQLVIRDMERIAMRRKSAKQLNQNNHHTILVRMVRHLESDLRRALELACVGSEDTQCRNAQTGDVLRKPVPAGFDSNHVSLALLIYGDGSTAVALFFRGALIDAFSGPESIGDATSLNQTIETREDSDEDGVVHFAAQYINAWMHVARRPFRT